jgi:hypothetical protein
MRKDEKSFEIDSKLLTFIYKNKKYECFVSFCECPIEKSLRLVLLAACRDETWPQLGKSFRLYEDTTLFEFIT